MATIIEDTTFQATATKSRSGYTIVREFLVADVTVDKDDMPWDALSDAGVPNTIGEAHPSQSLALLESVTATIADPSTPQIYRVTCTYQTQEGGGSAVIKEYGVVTSQIEQGWYMDGATPTRIIVHGRDDQNDRAKQAATIPVEVYQPTLTVTRNETSITPATLQSTYMHKINSATFEGLAAGKWLCTGIDCTTIDFELVSYKVVYQFLQAPTIYIPNTAETGTLVQTWDQIAHYVDENGVFPINNLDFAAPHTLRVTPYESVDFTALGF
jgi:hypothetical protein